MHGASMAAGAMLEKNAKYICRNGLLNVVMTSDLASRHASMSFIG